MNQIKKNKGHFFYFSNDDITVPMLMQFNRTMHEPKKMGQTLLVIDEASVKFNSRTWNAKDRMDFLSFFAQHRHYGFDIILVQQNLNQIDSQIRALVEIEVHHRHANNYWLYRWLPFQLFGEDNFKITICKQIIKGKKDPKQMVKRGQGGHNKKMAHSISRTKSLVLEKALCNDWNWFGTFTLDPKKYQRDDLDTFIKDLSQFIRDQRKKRQIDIKYLLIPELHKDGKNWHMHGLLLEIPYQDIEPHPLKKLSEKGYISWESYRQKFGFNSLGPIRDSVKTALYITKYISKNLDTTSIELNKKMYYCSRGLKAAEKIIEGQLTKPLDFPMAFEGLYSKSTFVNSVDWFKDYFKEFDE